MKVIIELDNDMLKEIRESDFEVSRKIVRDFQATISDSIRNGEPIPKGATNGDMIKAMFPDIKWGKENIKGKCIFGYKNKEDVDRKPPIIGIELDLWNAKYKKEVE